MLSVAAWFVAVNAGLIFVQAAVREFFGKTALIWATIVLVVVPLALFVWLFAQPSTEDTDQAVVFLPLVLIWIIPQSLVLLASAGLLVGPTTREAASRTSP
jgi:uncharacterized membrane protein